MGKHGKWISVGSALVTGNGSGSTIDDKITFGSAIDD